MWFRYRDTYSISTRLDPLEDVIDLVGSLRSSEYTADVARERHGVTAGNAQKRARAISSHVRLALEYLDQCYGGPRTVQFLPAYYSILNLLKVYILLGRHYDSLKDQRWHGASYSVDSKDSRSLATEVISIRTKGAIPLWYETVTGESLSTSRSITIGELLPFIADVGAEYSILTGKQSSLAIINLHVQGDGTRRLAYLAVSFPRSCDKRKLRILKNSWRKRPRQPNEFLGDEIPGTGEWETGMRTQLNNFLTYCPQKQRSLTPVCGWHLMLPEELPIALLFFHMSCVTRYKPEFRHKLEDSRYWPLLSAAMRHSMLRMLVLTWSFAHQRTLLINDDAWSG